MQPSLPLSKPLQTSLILPTLSRIEGCHKLDNDAFTLDDRKELIRQGLVLSSIEVDISELKILVEEDVKTKMEVRIRAMEDQALVFRSQIKAVLWVAALIGGFVSTGVEILFHVLVR